MKNNKIDINKILQSYDYLIYYTEENYYSPFDNRCLKSYIEDIEGGDNFTDYCQYFFELLEEEEYYE